MKQRVPRKIKKKIPQNTPYCYRKKVCPFYQNDEEEDIFGHCKLLKIEVEDQVKICGIGLGSLKKI